MGLQNDNMFWLPFYDILLLNNTYLLSVPKCHKRLSLYLLIYLMFIGQWYQELKHFNIR